MPPMPCRLLLHSPSETVGLWRWACEPSSKYSYIMYLHIHTQTCILRMQRSRLHKRPLTHAKGGGGDGGQREVAMSTFPKVSLHSSLSR